MEQTRPTCSGARPSMSTRFCAERSRPTSRSSSRPNLISYQFDDRQGARPRRAAVAARSRRRGDRMSNCHLVARGSLIDLVASIGIGGHLAMPPLPHHRAYGSVPRRFGGLSVHQLFHGRQAQTFEASVGEGAVHRVREAQSPRTFRAEDGLTGRRPRHAEMAKLMISLAPRLPLDPDDATQAPPDPAVERWQLVPLAEAEVAGPSPQVCGQLADHLFQLDAPM